MQTSSLISISSFGGVISTTIATILGVRKLEFRGYQQYQVALFA